MDYSITCVRNKVDNTYSFINKYGYLDCSICKNYIRIDDILVRSYERHCGIGSLLLRHLDGLALKFELPIRAVIDINVVKFYLKNGYCLYERPNGQTLVTKSLRCMEYIAIDILEDEEENNSSCCHIC